VASSFRWTFFRGLASCIGAQSREKLLEIRGHRRLELYRPVCRRMTKRQTIRMQCLPRKQNRSQLLWTEHVSLLPHEHVAAQPRLNTNLVALPGHELYFHERRSTESLEHAILADRILPARISRMRFLLDQRTLIPDEPIAPRPGFGRWVTIDDGSIHPLWFVAEELLFERGVCRRVLRDDDKPRGVAIDSMHDKRPAAAMRAKMALDFLDDRRRLAALGQRHGEQPWWFVHDDQVVVFVDYSKMANLAGRRAPRRAARAIHPHANSVTGDNAFGTVAC